MRTDSYEARLPSSESLGLPGETPRDVQPTPEYEGELKEIFEICQQLEGEERDILAMRYGFEPYSQPHNYKEIAQRYGQPTGWVRRRVVKSTQGRAPQVIRRVELKLDSRQRAKLLAVYSRLEGDERTMVAMRFGFDGYETHTYGEIAAKFESNDNHIRMKIRQLVGEIAGQTSRQPRFNRQQAEQARAVYWRFEDDNRELLAMRFGFDGYDPHSYEALATHFDKVPSGIAYWLQRLLDCQVPELYRMRFADGERQLAWTIYNCSDRLEDRRLLAKRYGFLGAKPHYYGELAEELGSTENSIKKRIYKIRREANVEVAGHPCSLQEHDMLFGGSTELDTALAEGLFGLWPHLGVVERRILAMFYGLAGTIPATRGYVLWVGRQQASLQERNKLSALPRHTYGCAES